MLFSLLKHYLEVYVTDTALKVSRSLHCFITPVSHGVENYFPRLWGTGISDTIFLFTKKRLLRITLSIISFKNQFLAINIKNM